MVKSCSDVIKVLDAKADNHYTACSFDVTDLYYSIPQDELLQFLEDEIDIHGPVAFQNAAGMTFAGFLELVAFYLNSTFSTWNGGTYIQKNGICIGSCIAPI
ncbi:hypothetical protein HPB48_020385 [Haemaphysalis longicornis]|uniref:Reverse transcriptase domain-containing protein n=1 Tax=Haemaphysalis longicornis TaxID=44386 RepID=A0A9J6FYW7_HAELO|nr:hypothetical protein HPB48_020385 [Haemaphysalis longicornis]